MKGGSPAYDLHQTDGLLSQESNIDHFKPLSVVETNPPEHYSNLYKVSGGSRKKKTKKTKKTKKKQNKQNKQKKTKNKQNKQKTKNKNIKNECI